MVAISGRAIRIRYDGATVLGARADSFTVAVTSPDATDKDSNGWAEQLDVPATRTVTAEVSGYLKSDLIADGAGSVTLEDCEAIISGIGRAEGVAFLTNITPTAAHDGTTEYSMTLQFSAPVGWLFAARFITQPSIAGTPEDGEVLTLTPGTVVSNPASTPAYQWQEDDGTGYEDIVGETALALTLGAGQEGNTIRCRQTETNSEGATVAFSNEIGPITA